jgi:hypothetical protein
MIGRRLAATVLATAAVSLAGATPVMAYAPVDVVHTERVQAGPYVVTVGFTTWPIRAMRSLDVTFLPDGGIAGKSGVLVMDGPGVKPDQHVRLLVRHPRRRDSWGLDTKAFGAPGSYSFTFVLDGPLGHGRGTLSGVTVLQQPGPALALSWSIASLPLIGLVAFLAVAWRRTQPGRQPLTVQP